MFSNKLKWESLENETFTIDSIDKTGSEFLLKNQVNATLSHGAFIAFLLAASRLGYPSIKLEKDRLYPALEDIWIADAQLMGHIWQGANTLPNDLAHAVIQKENEYFLQKNFTLQKKCFDEWERLKLAKPLLPIEPMVLEHKIKELQSGSLLTDEQRAALHLGLESSLFILTGGPGTGKTYTAARLLDTLLKCIQKPCVVALAAPTGKAALTLENALKNYFKEDIPFKAKTLHSLLGIRADGRVQKNIETLNADIILVDEASMIDMELMATLLASIKTGARLLLMGDPYQLPPVDGAPIFPKLCQEHLTVGKLTRCLRAETLELVHFAESIRTKVSFQPTKAVEFLDSQMSLDSLLESYFSRFPNLVPFDSPLEELFGAFQKFRILTPLKVGPVGAFAINQWVYKRLRKTGLNAVPLMITTNDYRLELFNGEMGIWLLQNEESKDSLSIHDMVYFPSGKKIPALLLPQHELAYAMTVHKSQGSEFDEVLLLLPKSPHPVSQELLYTAVTRARKKIALWGFMPIE